DLNGDSLQATLNVVPSTLVSLSIAPTSVTGGDTARGTVTLGSPAPFGGTLVQLTTTDRFLSVPASVIVTEGNTQATFDVTTRAVGRSSVGRVSAVLGNATQTASVTVLPVSLGSISIFPGAVRGGNGFQLRVTLTTPAPASGAVI